MEVITPKPFKSKQYEKWFTWATRRTIDMSEKEFAKTHKTWHHQPHWTKTIRVTIVQIKGEYLTDDQIYTWLNDGTQGPYPIPKSGTANLAFPSGYKAKTVPRTLFSGSGGPFGPTVFAKKVMHPGIEAREFDKTVANFVRPWFLRFGNIALKRATKASGHAI